MRVERRQPLSNTNSLTLWEAPRESGSAGAEHVTAAHGTWQSLPRPVAGPSAWPRPVAGSQWWSPGPPLGRLPVVIPRITTEIPVLGPGLGSQYSSGARVLGPGLGSQ